MRLGQEEGEGGRASVWAGPRPPPTLSPWDLPLTMCPILPLPAQVATLMPRLIAGMGVSDKVGPGPFTPGLEKTLGRVAMVGVRLSVLPASAHACVCAGASHG